MSSGDFALEAAYWLIENNGLDLTADLRDEYFCESLVGIQPKKLSDLAGIFLHSHDVYADEKTQWGPPKWQYHPTDKYDTFDYYARNGCPNCGAEFNFDFTVDFPLKNKGALLCKACGHKPCPMHTDLESESFVDRAESSRVDQENAGTYLRGVRRRHDFGQNGKEWWQSYYLPSRYRSQALQSRLTVSDLLGDDKGEKTKEICDVCGHDEAYFATYQARSADEGLTIMYECTRCHSRKTFNN